MANFHFAHGLVRIFAQELDIRGGDIKAAILMENQTVSVEEDKGTLAEFSDMDEYDGANYTRASLTGIDFSFNDSSNFLTVFGDPAVWNLLGPGTRDGVSLLIYYHGSSDSGDQIPLFYHEPTAWPLVGNGADVTVSPNSTKGWATVRRGA